MHDVATKWKDVATFQWEPFGENNQVPIGTVTGTVHFPKGVTASNSWTWLHTEQTSETGRTKDGSFTFTVNDVKSGEYLDVVAAFDAAKAGRYGSCRDRRSSAGVEGRRSRRRTVLAQSGTPTHHKAPEQLDDHHIGRPDIRDYWCCCSLTLLRTFTLPWLHRILARSPRAEPRIGGQTHRYRDFRRQTRHFRAPTRRDLAFSGREESHCCVPRFGGPVYRRGSETSFSGGAQSANRVRSIQAQ